VQPAAGLQHLVGVAGQPLLPPRVGDGAQQRQQGARRGQHDVTGEAVLEQTGFGLERAGQEAVGRHEQHGERGGRPEGGGIPAGGQRVDVRAQLPGVRGHALRPHRLVGRLDRLDVAGEGHLGVDHDLSAVGEGDHQVGTDPSTVVRRAARLLDEVAVLEQPRHLDHPPQLEFTPPAADVRGAQRGDQGRGLLPQQRGGLAHGAHLFPQLAVRGRAVALHAGDQPVQVVQRLVHRIEPGIVRPPAGERDRAEGDGGGEQGTE
jgi:hypothetical protein